MADTPAPNTQETSMQVLDIGIQPDDVPDEFPVAPAGTYLCSITKAEMGKSKADKPMVTFGFSPINPIVCQAGQVQITVQGRQLFKTYASLQPDALFTLKKITKATGGKGWHGSKLNVSEYIGSQVNVKVKQRQDASSLKMSNEVEDVLAV